MDTSVRYQVVFSGRLRKGYTAAEVKRNLAKRLQLPVEKVEQLFRAGRAVLKQTPSLEEAKRVVVQLATTGAIATIERSPAAATVKTSAPAASTPPTKTATPPATLRPFTPLGSRLFLQPLLVLGAAREVLFNLIYAALLLVLLLLLVAPSVGSEWIGQLSPLPIPPLVLDVVIFTLAGLLLLLLLKPLLSLMLITQPGLRLDPVQEPGIYEFVEDVCEHIGAPLPSEIRLQEDAEIRVSYQHGPQGWLENNIVVTLGLPLTAGLNCSQLAALLARRLSRYRRNTVPQATAILMHGHTWLQRAAYGEDIVDRTLKQWHEKGQLGDGPFRVVQTALAPSRRLVIWRLRVSRALDRRVMHRLMAEADELALGFAGKEGFIRMLDQASLLSFVGNNLLRGLKEQWRSKKVLPGNLVQLMVLRSRQYPVNMPQKLRLLQERHKAAVGDIIPSDIQRLKRIANVTVEPEELCLAPAAGLFHHYGKLTRSMTLRYYHHRLHLPVSSFQLQQVYGKKSLEHLQQQRLDKYFRQLYIDFLPLKLRQRLRDISNLDEAKQQWSLGLARCKSEYKKAVQAKAHFNNSEATLVEASLREEIHLAGLWRQWGEEKLNSSALEEVHQDARDSEREYQQALHSLEQYIKAYAIRMGAVLAALNQNAGAALDGANELREEVQRLLATLELIENLQTQLRELKMQNLLLETLLSLKSSGRNGKLDDRIEQQSADVQHLTRAIGFALKNAAYPFTDGKAKQLKKYVLQNALKEESPQGDFDRGNDTVEMLAQVQRRALVRLTTITEQLEKVMGFR